MRLAKKVMHMTPVITTTQNMLIKKMGCSSPIELKTEDFERYIQVFEEGLSEEQARLIDELFVPHVSAVELQKDDAAEAS
jgi:hypothetical protein